MKIVRLDLVLKKYSMLKRYNQLSLCAETLLVDNYEILIHVILKLKSKMKVLVKLNE